MISIEKGHVDPRPTLAFRIARLVGVGVGVDVGVGEVFTPDAR